MENMNIIGITRVFNEDDIIESFVRHHSIFLIPIYSSIMEVQIKQLIY
ncbi:Glycosyltransferase [Granulibacter bethesdensis]|nr:Glycosyltransferase [Granulibacter bethesdensis]